VAAAAAAATPALTKPKLAPAAAPKAGTSIPLKDVSKGAAALEPKLAGSRYLGGDKPSAADVKAFDELLGAGNVHLFRWVKSVAAVPAKERAKWKAAPKAKPAPAKPKVNEVAAAKHRDPAVLQSRVQLDLAPWSADVDLAALAADIRSCEAPVGMVWEPGHQVTADGHLAMAATVEDTRVCADDVEELVMQFESLIRVFKIAAWQKL
jgi:translation elongation factor EF-1beta